MAAPSTITVTADSEEYSRHYEDDSIVTATVTTTGAGVLGEVLTVELIKARRNDDVVVATKQMTMATNDDPQSQDVSFDLKKIVDSGEVPKVRRGKYLVRVTSDTDTNITGDSEVFDVSLFTVDWLRANFLHGTDQKASDVLSVLEQPVAITGVTVFEVSRGHPQDWFTLTHTYQDDGGGNIKHFLSWDCGPQVEITSGRKTFTLKGGTTANYIRVRISAIAALPTTNVTESLLVERKALDESQIRNLVAQATSWVEDVALQAYIEPTRVMTQVTVDNITYDTGSDIPNFINGDWDEIVDAVQYKRPAPGHWIGFKMPYRPIIQFDSLFGQVANTRIVDIALEWIEHHRQWVELVPFNQEVAFNFIGLVWVESIRNPVALPNFWNFNALVGFKKTPKVILELIAKKAAIDVLTIAGQAFRGGFSSQSVSRDGISESVSYTASATYGIYSATIEDYRKWIEAELPNIRGSFRGPNMTVL